MHFTYDSATNTLRLCFVPNPRHAAKRTVSLSGVLDVGEDGTLVGIELRADFEQRVNRAIDLLATAPDGAPVRLDHGSAYIDLDTAGHAVRAVEVDLLVELAAGDELVAIAIPRRGAGYEIAYPSGKR